MTIRTGCDKMRERTRKIRENVSPQVKSADEHLLLSYLVHLMLYRAQKNHAGETAVAGEIRAWFPGFEDDGILTGL